MQANFNFLTFIAMTSIGLFNFTQVPLQNIVTFMRKNFVKSLLSLIVYIQTTTLNYFLPIFVRETCFHQEMSPLIVLFQISLICGKHFASEPIHESRNKNCYACHEYLFLETKEKGLSLNFQFLHNIMFRFFGQKLLYKHPTL